VGKFMMFEYNDYPDNYFDAVLAFDTLEHMYAPFITIGEIRRVLKDGGIFYHSTPTISEDMKIPWHVSLFSADTWKWLFEWWDFKVVEERVDPDRITQVLRKEKYTKFESYHKLVGIY
jgi:SAM-dependent methyltransferase